MSKMTREKFDEKIQDLEDRRGELLAKMEELADKYGFSFNADHGGSNEYFPEGKKDCDECEGAGKFKEWLGYIQPDGSVSYKYAAGKSVYGPEEECGVCEGTGKVDVEYPGWQKSYC